MKKRFVFGSLLALVVGFQASAQRVENDDMYFNSKDREKLKAVQAEGSLQAYSAPKKKKDRDTEQVISTDETTNPSDTYSARSINPEYVSRLSSEQANSDEQNYYVEGYTANTYDSYSSTKYTSTANPNNFNNNLGYANNYNGGYNPYSWDNRYGYNNPYASPYGNPYSNGSGWNFSLGYYSGSAFGSGWNYGLNYMWGNSFYNPYSYCPSYFSPYYSYGGYNNNYYGVSSERSTRNYGKRPSRNSAFVTPTQQRVVTQTSSTNSSGRMRQSTDDYYVKPARRSSNFDWSTISNTNRDGNSNGSRTRSSYASPSRSSGSSYSSPSRSSSGGSPSRSGGSGGGRSRSGN